MKKQRRILLPPDAYHLWALIPDLILNYDKVIMDRDDYEVCQAKKDETTYNALAAQATKRYLEEGFLELGSLRALTNRPQLEKFDLFAKDVIASKSPKVIEYGAEMFEHWVRYCDSKIMFYPVDEPGFKSVGADKGKATHILDHITKTGEPPEQSDFYKIIRFNIIKALIAINASNTLNIPCHDIATVKPAIQLIGEYFKTRSPNTAVKQGEGTQSANLALLPAEPMEVAMRTKTPADVTLTLLYQMASTGAAYSNPDCIRQIIADRDGFAEYRKSLIAMDNLYNEIYDSVRDDELTRRKLELELLRVRELIEAELVGIRKKHKVIWFTLDLLSTLYVPILTNFATLIKEKAEEKHLDNTIKQVYPQYKWFYAFQKMVRSTPQKPLASGTYKGNMPHSSWCAGSIPWYVS